MTDLMRFGSGLSGTQLRNLLEGTTNPTVRPLGYQLDLTEMFDAVAAFTAADGAINTSTDADFAPTVHRTFRSLPRRHLLDHRFWQWLSCTEFREYVRARWAPDVDFTIEATLKPSQQARFLGNAGLNGLGRNALSRLFWAAHVMQDDSHDYALTKALFRKQDLAVGVLERSFGLIPAVARACASELADLSEAEHREALKRLNLRSSTVLLEGASEADVRALLRKST